MAITPRTIFSSAAPATVAAVSLLAFTAVGSVAYMSAQECDVNRTSDGTASAAATGCEDLREALGADPSTWSESNWVQYANCFQRRHNSRAAVDAASKGLKYYPNSAALFNIKGYHEISLDRHKAAVDTLRTALNRVNSSYTGVLENNLAWAGLWAPREMDLAEARNLYRRALDKKPRECAYVHTGLWVEYTSAQQNSGVDRFKALRKFDTLRTRYTSCLSRLEQGDWKTVAEIAGAAVMFSDLQDGERGSSSSADDGPTGDELLERVARTVDEQYSGVSVDGLCQDAMPVATTHQTCVDKLDAAMTKITEPETEPEDTEASADDANGGGAGGPCPAMVQ